MPCDPATPLLGIYPKEYKSAYDKTHAHFGTIHNSPVLESALMSLTYEWIKKM
jgi:hypothetical protein